MKFNDLRLLLAKRRGRRLFLTVLSAALCWAAIVVINAFLIAEIVVRIIDHRGGTAKLIFGLGILWLWRAFFLAGFDHWCTSKAILIKRDVRREVTSHVENYVTVSPSELSTILTKGLNSLDIYLGKFIPQLIFAAVTPVAVISTLFLLDPLAGLIALITLPLIPLFGALIGRYSGEAVNRKWRTLGVLSQYFEDSLRGFATLRIFGRTKSQSTRIAEMGDRYTSETMKVLRISFLSAFALELVATISVAVVAVSVGLRLVSGSIDFKTALVVLVLAPEVYFPVRNAASLFHASQDGTQALRELARVSSTESAAVVQVERIILAQDIESVSWPRWKIEHSGVEEVGLPAATVKRGEMLFIVGESGIGKTSFARNLLGFAHDAQITLNGEGNSFALDSTMQKSWQNFLGWIPQNPQLASGSVRDQFKLIMPNVRDDQIESALLEAGLPLAELPAGLETKLGRGGESSHAASGGQIRRIAVARALIRNPWIVIADEPTADLDDQSALKVMGALRRLQNDGAIVICITHDVDQIAGSDLICAVERRRI